MAHARRSVVRTVFHHWPWLIVATGTLLRVAQYAHDRSLWFDEALLALNILHRPLRQLLEPLDYNQGAPIGFLFLQKLVSNLFGGSELALRAIPLAAGVASLFLFWRVARMCSPPKVVPLALALFALSSMLVSFSSEVKQYSTDAAIALLLLGAALRCRRSALATGDLAGLGALGAVAIWFSHPASFVLAGVAAGLTLEAARGREWRQLRRLTLLWFACGLSFAMCYAASLRGLSQNHALLDFWQVYFFPPPIWSWHSAAWFLDRCYGVVGELVDAVPVVGAGLIAAGVGVMWRRSKQDLSILTAPIAVAAAAAALHKYPFGGRLLLFFCPVLLLLLAEGTTWCAEKVGRLSPVAAVVLVGLVLAQPVAGAAWRLAHPPVVEDIRPVIAYIRSHERPGDTWYVYHFARFQFWYYADRQHLPLERVRIGDDCGRVASCYFRELDQLRGTPRVWILFSHIWTGDGVNEEDLFVRHLDSMGTRSDEYRAMQARAYLYDLRPQGK